MCSRGPFECVGGELRGPDTREAHYGCLVRGARCAPTSLALHRARQPRTQPPAGGHGPARARMRVHPSHRAACSRSEGPCVRTPLLLLFLTVCPRAAALPTVCVCAGVFTRTPRSAPARASCWRTPSWPPPRSRRPCWVAWRRSWPSAGSRSSRAGEGAEGKGWGGAAASGLAKRRQPLKSRR